MLKAGVGMLAMRLMDGMGHFNIVWLSQMLGTVNLSLDEDRHNLGLDSGILVWLLTGASLLLLR